MVRPLRTRLQEARQRLGLPWEALERDYLLSWVLAGIAQTPNLSESLVFKGGTALKKCYFSDYRFSEDLDFTGLDASLTGKAMESSIKEAVSKSVEILDEYGPIGLECQRYTERNPHPGGQEAFVIRAQMPWQNRHQTRILVEVTFDEKVLWPVASRRVIHEYGEPLEAEVLIYSLEEVVAEKLRAILQHADALERRGWSRSRARDYYDLWRVLTEYRERMDPSDFASKLRDKCAFRNVTYTEPADFFASRMIDCVGDTWSQSLGPLVPGLPAFDSVIEELRPQVLALITGDI